LTVSAVSVIGESAKASEKSDKTGFSARFRHAIVTETPDPVKATCRKRQAAANLQNHSFGSANQKIR